MQAYFTTSVDYSSLKSPSTLKVYQKLFREPIKLIFTWSQEYNGTFVVIYENPIDRHVAVGVARYGSCSGCDFFMKKRNKININDDDIEIIQGSIMYFDTINDVEINVYHRSFVNEFELMFGFKPKTPLSDWKILSFNLDDYDDNLYEII